MIVFANVITFIAIGVFSVSGVLAGVRKGADIFSLLVFGLVTALGGGTIRDMILNIPVFWVDELNYIWVAAGAAVLAFLFIAWLPRGKSCCYTSTL
jgi:uncharacterized membrane protein YeiH